MQLTIYGHIFISLGLLALAAGVTAAWVGVLYLVTDLYKKWK